MPDVDSNFLSHFRELHLLPRTIYGIGAALFITALFTKDRVLGFCGVGIIFLAVAGNMLIDAFWSQDGKRRERIWWGALVQMGLALVLAVVTLWLAYLNLSSKYY